MRALASRLERQNGGEGRRVPHRIRKTEPVDAALWRLIREDLAKARHELHARGPRKERIHRVRQRLKRVRCQGATVPNGAATPEVAEIERLWRDIGGPAAPGSSGPLGGPVGVPHELPADYVVLASGSSYPFPAKSDLDSTAAALEKYAAASDRVARAERVLLIGAGAVGIELAGEIKAAWPDTSVVLLDAMDDVLGDRYRADLRAELRAQLEGIGVELMLGTPLRGLPPVPATELCASSTMTSSGQRSRNSCRRRSDLMKSVDTTT